MFNFGQRLTSLLRLSDITQKQLAAHLSFDPSYISRIRKYSLSEPENRPPAHPGSPVLSAVRANPRLKFMVADSDERAGVLPSRVNIFASRASVLCKSVSASGICIHVVADSALAESISSQLVSLAQEGTPRSITSNAAEYLERCIKKLEILKTLD